MKTSKHISRLSFTNYITYELGNKIVGNRGRERERKKQKQRESEREGEARSGERERGSIDKRIVSFYKVFQQKKIKDRISPYCNTQ